jgi:hypothetical protein
VTITEDVTWCLFMVRIEYKGWFSSLANGLIVHSRNGSSVRMGDAALLPLKK